MPNKKMDQQVKKKESMILWMKDLELFLPGIHAGFSNPCVLKTPGGDKIGLALNMLRIFLES